MKIFGKLIGKEKELTEELNQLKEQLSAFKPSALTRDDKLDGEGFGLEEVAFGNIGLSSFNLFYNSEINKFYKGILFFICFGDFSIFFINVKSFNCADFRFIIYIM